MKSMKTREGDVILINTGSQLEIHSLNNKKIWDKEYLIHNFLQYYMPQYGFINCNYKSGRLKFGRILKDMIKDTERKLEELKFARIVCSRNKIVVVNKN